MNDKAPKALFDSVIKAHVGTAIFCFGAYLISATQLTVTNKSTVLLFGAFAYLLILLCFYLLLLDPTGTKTPKKVEVSFGLIFRILFLILGYTLLTVMFITKATYLYSAAYEIPVSYTGKCQLLYVKRTRSDQRYFIIKDAQYEPYSHRDIETWDQMVDQQGGKNSCRKTTCKCSTEITGHLLPNAGIIIDTSINN